MSRSYRPVVETWGSPTGFSGVPADIEDILSFIHHEASPDGSFEANDYGDLRSVFISDGRTFIDYIMKATLEELCEDCDVECIPDSERRECLRMAIADIKSSAAADWQNHIDAQDGSLRFYIDQY